MPGFQPGPTGKAADGSACCNCDATPPKPCNTSLSAGIYGCGLSDNWQGKSPNVTITRPDGTVVSVNNSGASTPLNMKGSYTVTGSASGYRPRSYTFNYGQCDGINYSVLLSLTPTSVFMLGSICGNAGVNITASGAFSGSCVSFGDLQITNDLEAGQTVTYTGQKDRYKTRSVTVNTVAPQLADTASRKYIKVGGTLQFCGADLSLEPEDCYVCWQNSTDPTNPNLGYFCEYPVTKYVTVTTPIGSVVAPLFGTAKLSYTGPTVTGCCTGPVEDRPIDFTIGGQGEVSYPTCFSSNQCGRPIPADLGPECQGTGFGGTGSNQGNASDGGYCTRNQKSYCPPGLIFEFDTVDAAFLSGHYTVTEFGCGPDGGGYGSEAPSEETQARFALRDHDFDVSPMAAPQPLPAAADGRVRVGLVTPHLNYGGGEVWNLMLMKTTASAVNWVGVVCTDPAEKTNPDMAAATSKLAPITYGLDKINDLASKCDVIITWLVEDWDRYAGNTAAKVVYVMHFAQDREYSSLVQWCLKRTTALVGVSELCNPGVPASWINRYKVIYNAVDTDKMIVRRPKAVIRDLWGVPLSAKVALFYARIHLTRRPDAMVRLVSSLPSDWHCVVMGDTQQSQDEYQTIVSMIAALPAADRARIHLLPADPATGDVMNAADVLVNPTSADSFGLAMVEAMAVRLPVVSTSCGVARLHPEYVYPIALDDTGSNLAKAVLAAYSGGPKLGAQSFAAVACSPVTFGASWTTLIQTTAGLPIVVPNILSKATSFVRAMAGHAASGFEMADEATVEQRESICGTCPYLVNENTCGKCGCALKAKRALASSQCPIGRW